MHRIWIGVLGLSVMLLSACGGGSSDPVQLNDQPTGVIEGYITDADIDRGTSQAGDGIGGVEVWCEEPGSGLRLGQDTTDETGHYRIGGLPEGEEMMLRFRYRYQYQNQNQEMEAEGEQQIRIQERQQLRIDAGLCLRDADDDGEVDEIDCDNTQMQVRLRQKTQGGQGGQGNQGNQGS